MRAVQKLEAGETAVGLLRWPQRAARLRFVSGRAISKRYVSDRHLRVVIEREYLAKIAMMGDQVTLLVGQVLRLISFLF